MGLFEKFTSQPRWKHPDPSVRAASVYDLGVDEGGVLVALARDDGEARVRRAAVVRLQDVAVLGEVLRTDPDAEVRADALRQLVGVAVETHDGSTARRVFEELVMAGRSRDVAVVARESGDVGVRFAAVDALADSRALAQVARQAPDEATRRRALARVTNDEDLAQVALKAEQTDAAVSALDRVIAPAVLQAVSQRARNKAAVRKAKARLRLLEEAAQGHPVRVDAVRMSAEDRQRGDALVAEVEALVSVTGSDTVGSTLSRLNVAWAELRADTPIDPALEHRFDAALEALRDAAAAREAELREGEERRQARQRETSDRESVCQAIEGLDGDAALDRFAELKVQWDALPGMSPDYAASLTRRFQDACRRFEERERRRALSAVAAGRLDALATELEQLAASEQPTADVLARWRMVRRDAELLREMSEANPEAAQRVEAAVVALEEREQEHQQAKAQQAQDSLKQLTQLCRRLETLAGQEGLTLKAGERALADVREALASKTSLPTKADRQRIQTRLEAIREVLAPRVQELRDADEWQRWANLHVQEDLTRQMEALATEEQPEKVVRLMRELQGRWRAVALAPRAQGEAIWRRFKAAQDVVYARTSSFVAAQQEARAANQARKEALCQRAEALSGSSDWAKTAAALQALQAEWKTVGQAARGQEKALWERFRRACDGFFTRRQEDLKKRKDEWSQNLAKKEALCAEAEALSQSGDWEPTAAALKRLQAEWKGIGPVRRSKAEALWQRFRTACDTFFERYKHKDQIALQEKVAVRATVVKDLAAALADTADAPAPDGLYDLVHRARATWQQAPEVPRSVQHDLAQQYHETLSRIVTRWPAAFAGTDLDPEATRKRMEKILSRVEHLLANQASSPVAASPAELLAQRWRERLAANTMSGGQGKGADDAREREVEQEIRSAQQQWMRLGPVPASVAGPLNERFQRVCRKFFDTRKRAS
jgi:hypothetical protein